MDNQCLSGWWFQPTPLKNVNVNWEDDIPNIWENKKSMFQSPPTSYHGHGIGRQAFTAWCFWRLPRREFRSQVKSAYKAPAFIQQHRQPWKHRGRDHFDRTWVAKIRRSFEFQMLRPYQCVLCNLEITYGYESKPHSDGTWQWKIPKLIRDVPI